MRGCAVSLSVTRSGYMAWLCRRRTFCRKRISFTITSRGTIVRIYIVKTNSEPVRYVRAVNQSAAIKAVVNERFSAVVATTEDIVAASKAGRLDVLDASTPAVLSAANESAPTLTDDATRHNSRMPVDA
jgi:hypothetical protein